MSLSDARFRELFDQAPVMMLLIDVATAHVVECNPAVLNRLHSNREQWIGVPIGKFLSGDSMDWMTRDLQKLSQKSPSIERELRVHCGDVLLDVEQRLTVMSRDPGSNRYAICVWLPRGDRPQVEAEFNESWLQLQAILDHTSLVVFVKDLDGRYLLINRKFVELFELSLEEVRGKTDFDVFPDEIASVFRENDRRVLYRKDSMVFEEHVLHRDGSHTYISERFLLYRASGEPYAVCGISTDITERKRVEAALHESETRFRQLADNMPHCFWILDASTWKTLYVSPAFDHLWGHSRKQVYADSEIWFQSIHDADRDRVKRALMQSVSQGEYDEEYRVVRPDGSIRWVHDHGVPICDQGDRVIRVVGLAQDITDRKVLQKQVSDVSASEQQRIGQEIHDELGQQLTGLSFLAKSLQRKLSEQSLAEAEDAAAIAEGIQDSIGEVRRLVRGLAPVDLDENGLKIALEHLVDTIAQRSQIQCRLTIAFEVRMADNTIATHLFRIAQEAVNNAVKHSEAQRIDVSLIGHEGMILLRIHDDGNGMSGLQKGASGRTSQGSMGLEIMRHRAAIIGANLEIKSSSDFGTEVVCMVRSEASEKTE